MHARQCREDRQQVGCAAIGTTWLLWKRKLQELLSADGRREQHVHCDPWTRIGPQGQGDQSAKGRWHSHAPEKQKFSNSCVWSFPSFHRGDSVLWSLHWQHQILNDQHLAGMLCCNSPIL